MIAESFTPPALKAPPFSLFCSLSFYSLIDCSDRQRKRKILNPIHNMSIDLFFNKQDVSTKQFRNSFGRGDGEKKWQILFRWLLFRKLCRAIDKRHELLMSERKAFQLNPPATEDPWWRRSYWFAKSKPSLKTHWLLCFSFECGSRNA